MEGNAQGTPGMDALKNHIILNKIDVSLWFTRGLTLFFSFFYLIPIFWSPYNTYYKALAAYAATSALRLHQRLPFFRLNMQFFASLLMEDSCHYLIYSMIFFYVAPFTSCEVSLGIPSILMKEDDSNMAYIASMVLIPIFCFSLIHFASYSIRLLDVLGPNTLWMARLLISLVEFNARSILNLIAFTEIILTPFCIILVFTGRASFLTPFMYHQFLLMRYKSQRNPSTRNMFTELRMSATYIANHQRTPAIVKNLIFSGINFVCWLGPTVITPPSQ